MVMIEKGFLFVYFSAFYRALTSYPLSPWPGMIVHSKLIMVLILFMLDFNSSSLPPGKSVLPTPSLNMVSPLMKICCSSQNQQQLPGECPGV